MDKNFILQTKLTENQIALFYLGQTGFLLKYQSDYILVDGYLTDYVDQNCCSEQVSWKRRYPAPISPEELDFVQYVFCTHAHYDHADPNTLSTIAQRNPDASFFVSAAITDTIASYGIPRERIRGLRCDQEITLRPGLTVAAVPAAHEELHPVGSDTYEEVGFRFTLGGISLFHSGDCCPYDGLEDKISGCDIFVLPINGRDYYRTNVCDIIGCFNSREAILLAKHCGAGLLVPVHFDLYDVNGANPSEFVDTLQFLNPSQRFHIFVPGQR